jgi:hypothetical protein
MVSPADILVGNCYNLDVFKVMTKALYSILYCFDAKTMKRCQEMTAEISGAGHVICLFGQMSVTFNFLCIPYL